MIKATGQIQDYGFDDGFSGPDLTTLLDVIFLLLVFFILTANSVEHALELDLPKQGADQAKPVKNQETITLTLFPDEERWAVEGQTLDHWEIVEKTIIETWNERPDADVIIAGDRGVTLERLLQALAFLQREGIDTAQILMEADDIASEHRPPTNKDSS